MYYFTDLNYEYINIGNGVSLVVCQGYTYSFKGPKSTKRYLYCSRTATTKCSARINLSKDGKIIYADTNHNHDPPYYKKTKDGIYVKIT